jgi:hypothetical protein
MKLIIIIINYLYFMRKYKQLLLTDFYKIQNNKYKELKWQETQWFIDILYFLILNISCIITFKLYMYVFVL